MALVVVMAGIVAMLVALLSGSSSPNSDNPAQSRTRAIEPVEPLDPNDADAEDVTRDDSLDSLSDPFASSFGEGVKHKVLVRFTANGPGGVGIRYSDRRTVKTTFTGSYSSTRTFKSRFPTVQAAMQIYPPASTGSCTVIIDGVRVSSNTTNKRYGVVVCGG